MSLGSSVYFKKTQRVTALIDFKPDDELVDLTGSKAGALNVHLERVFGYAARSTGDGILPILERGPAVCAMHKLQHPE